MGQTRRPGIAEPGTISRLFSRILYSARSAARGPFLVESFLPDSQLHDMFENIGTTYDVQNHLLSFGRDIHWRQILALLVGREPAEVVCDMATGTGDVAIELARRYRSLRIFAVDYSQKMLAVADSKIRKPGNARIRDRIQLIHSDIRRTPVAECSADVVTISFALRNIPERRPALEEFFRVLKPGGRLFIMEFALPQSRFIGRAYRLYFDHVMPFIGNLLSRTDYAYSYLKESVHGFPSPERFSAEIAAAGFDGVKALPLTFGLSTVYCARRPRTAAARRPRTAGEGNSN
ncbi:MAG TPA: ubiquinone/menaquinone biosynthesis methyltransferase [Spirochaetia bacterium]|nr:ubiquinone/menaquinone biosynthesis methyltransferase [Spirochaetia bacterium]